MDEQSYKRISELYRHALQYMLTRDIPPIKVILTISAIIKNYESSSQVKYAPLILVQSRTISKTHLSPAMSAAKATIYKAVLNISDLDRHYYAEHHLTLACHPSETEERMMLRVIAFAMFAGESLQFTKGISTEDEPDLWAKNLSGEIEHWIELGTPQEDRIKRGCSRSKRMTVLSYGSRVAPVWWEKIQSKLTRFKHLDVWFIDSDTSQALAALCARAMQCQVTIQDGRLWFSTELGQVEIDPTRWQ